MKAKLQNHLAYKYKEKRHFKHILVIPDDAITELGWKGSQDLDLIVKEGQLIIKSTCSNQDAGA